MARLSRTVLPVLLLLLATARPACCEVPPYGGPVTDAADILPSEARKKLTDKLTKFAKEGGIPITVLTVPSTRTNSMEEFIGEMLVAWSGQRPAREGVILIVALREGRLQLQIGSLASEKLSQDSARKIIDQVITPPFRENRFSAGIEAGTDAIMKILSADRAATKAGTEAAEAGGDEEEIDNASVLVVCVVAALFVGGILRTVAGALGGALAGAAVMGVSAVQVAEASAGTATLFAAIAGLAIFSVEIFGSRWRYTERVFAVSTDKRSAEEELGGASGNW